MDKTLTWFIRGWIGLAIVVNGMAVIGIFIGAPSIWAGLTRLADIYSPFNIMNVVLELLLLSPALAAYYWRDRRRERV